VLTQQEKGLAQAGTGLHLLPGAPQQVRCAVARELPVGGGRKEREQEQRLAGGQPEVGSIRSGKPNLPEERKAERGHAHHSDLPSAAADL
jgi:hypothetical protein